MRRVRACRAAFRSSDLRLTVTVDSYGRTALITMLRWCQTPRETRLRKQENLKNKYKPVERFFTVNWLNVIAYVRFRYEVCKIEHNLY